MANNTSFIEYLKPAHLLSKKILTLISAEALNKLAAEGTITSYSIKGNPHPLFHVDTLEDELNKLVIKTNRIQLDVIPVVLDSLPPEYSIVPKELRLVQNELREYNFIEKYCVYFLMDMDTVVYVGQSNCLPTRITTHLGEGKKIFTRVLYLPVPKQDMIRIESALIRFLKPKYNLALLVSKGKEIDIPDDSHDLAKQILKIG